MDRIKDLNEVKVQGGELWCELIIKEKKSLIIDVNDKHQIDYMIVRNIGEHVTDVEKEDVILSTNQTDFEVVEIKGKKYTKIHRNRCIFIVDKNNFEATK